MARPFHAIKCWARIPVVKVELVFPWKLILKCSLPRIMPSIWIYAIKPLMRMPSVIMSYKTPRIKASRSIILRR